MTTPDALGSDISASKASIAAMMSPYAAECAKADGRSGDTTPGTRTANPMKRKLCRMSRGCNASARGRRRSSGQMYRAVTIPHAMKLKAMLTKNQIICCGMTNVSFQKGSLPAAAAMRGESLECSWVQRPQRHQGSDGNVLVIHQLCLCVG